MIRATLDSNIYISALAFGGEPKRLLQMAQIGQIEIAVSDDILDEVSRILGNAKFAWPPERVAVARNSIWELTQHFTPMQKLNVVEADASDNKILECAQTSHSDVVISGDKHLLRLKFYEGMPILKVTDFLSRSGQS